DDIKEYKGTTLTQRIIGNNSLTMWFVFLVFLISFAPDIVWKWDTIKNSGAFELFIVQNWTGLVMRGISCLSLFCILRISFSFIHCLEEDRAFERLFKISDKKGL